MVLRIRLSPATLAVAAPAIPGLRRSERATKQANATADERAHARVTTSQGTDASTRPSTQQATRQAALGRGVAAGAKRQGGDNKQGRGRRSHPHHCAPKAMIHIHSAVPKASPLPTMKAK
jgi:hypothetical protein